MNKIKIRGCQFIENLNYGPNILVKNANYYKKFVVTVSFGSIVYLQELSI